MKKNRKVIKLVHGQHPAIIQEKEFNEVQDILDHRRKVKYIFGRRSPLSGILVCSKCGRTMTFHGGNERSYYECRDWHYGQKVCQGVTIRCEAIDPIVQDLIFQFSQDPVVVGKSAKWVNLKDDETVKEFEEELEGHRGSLEDIKKKIGRLLTLYEDGKQEFEEVEEHLTRLEREKKGHQKAIEEIESRIEMQKKILIQLNGRTIQTIGEKLRKLWDTIPVQEKNYLLSQLIKKIETNGKHAEIFFHFPVNGHRKRSLRVKLLKVKRNPKGTWHPCIQVGRAIKKVPEGYQGQLNRPK